MLNSEQNSGSSNEPLNIHQMAYKGDLQQIKVRILENPK